MNELVTQSRFKTVQLVLIAVAAGTGLGIGFVLPVLALAALFGVIGCVYLIQTSQSRMMAFLLLTIAWTIKSLFAISWFWSAYPIEWIDLNSPVVQLLVIFLYWFTGAVWLGLGGGFVGLVMKWATYLKSIPLFIWYTLLPLVWVGGELAGAFTFSFVTLGPGSYLQPYFSFGFSGYLLGYVPAGLLIAPYAGVYGLTVVVVVVSTLGYIVFKKYSWWSTPCIALVFLVGLITSVPSVQVVQGIEVISINTSFDAAYLSTNKGQLERARLLDEAVLVALTHSPDYILLPEDSRYLDAQFGAVTGENVVSKFQFIHPDSTSVLIDSGRTELPDGTSVVRAHVLDSAHSKLYQFDKQYLVPQGEYVPYVYGALMKLFGYGPLIEQIASDSSYRPGPLLQTGEMQTVLPGILFCFESVRPDGVAAVIGNRNVPFVAHPISHGWFHSSTVLWQQLDVMLQIQARAGNMPIVSAGNMVAGKLYQTDGTIESGTLLERGERYELRLFSL